MKIPEEFHVPMYAEFEIRYNYRIMIVPLSRLMALEDYTLVISNRRHLKGVFGELDDWWPSDNLSKEENYNMLLWHENQFIKRKSFAYAIMLNNKYVGCFYIYGLEEVYKIVSVKEPNLLYVFMWTSEKIFYSGEDKLIFNCLKSWIEKEWNFAKADYPGRVTPLVSFTKYTATWIKTTRNENRLL